MEIYPLLGKIFKRMIYSLTLLRVLVGYAKWELLESPKPGPVCCCRGWASHVNQLFEDITCWPGPRIMFPKSKVQYGKLCLSVQQIVKILIKEDKYNFVHQAKL